MGFAVLGAYRALARYENKTGRLGFYFLRSKITIGLQVPSIQKATLGFVYQPFTIYN